MVLLQGEELVLEACYEKQQTLHNAQGEEIGNLFRLVFSDQPHASVWMAVRTTGECYDNDSQMAAYRWLATSPPSPEPEQPEPVPAPPPATPRRKK